MTLVSQRACQTLNVVEYPFSVQARSQKAIRCMRLARFEAMRAEPSGVQSSRAVGTATMSPRRRVRST